MKSDLDQLMAERGLDAIIVPAGEGYNALLAYLTGGVIISRGFALKKRGEAPFLVVSGMEIEEAGATGLEAITLGTLGYADLMAAHDPVDAEALLWGRGLERAGLTGGNIGVYGDGPLHFFMELFKRLGELLPGFTFSGETGKTIFDLAYETKDADELARLLSVAERTSAVVRATYDYISSHRADSDETVVREDGTPLTIGDVKRFVRRELMDRGLDEHHMIFAQGRDGGFPHSRGREDMPLKLGQAIVFDLFPFEAGGGYYHDMTRTWCIGYAPDEVREAYEQVREAFDIASELIAVGKPTHIVQEAVQDYFEARGHKTLRSHPNAQDGYTHSLGHGIGLNIHEAPSMRHSRKDDTFRAGNVVTIEPGLYYPERGFGIRIEDTVLLEPNGLLTTLTDVPKDLILPLRG